MTPTRFRLIFFVLASVGLLSFTALTDLGERVAGGGLAAQAQQAQAPPQPAQPPTGRAGGADTRTTTGRGGSGSQGQGWWNDLAIRKEIGLSAEKAKQIDDMYQQFTKRNKPLVDELDRQREAQQKMARAATTELDTYRVIVVEVEALRSRLNESRTMLFYQMYKTLQPEQNRKLQEIFDRQAAERPNGGGRQGGGTGRGRQ